MGLGTTIYIYTKLGVHRLVLKAFVSQRNKRPFKTTFLSLKLLPGSPLPSPPTSPFLHPLAPSLSLPSPLAPSPSPHSTPFLHPLAPSLALPSPLPPPPRPPRSRDGRSRVHASPSLLARPDKRRRKQLGEISAIVNHTCCGVFLGFWGST